MEAYRIEDIDYIIRKLEMVQNLLPAEEYEILTILDDIIDVLSQEEE